MHYITHLSHVDEINSGSDVVVQCNDADVVILIYHVKRFSVKLCIDVSMNSDNSR